MNKNCILLKWRLKMIHCEHCEDRVGSNDKWSQDCCKNEKVLKHTLSDEDKLNRELLGRYHIPVLSLALQYCPYKNKK